MRSQPAEPITEVYIPAEIQAEIEAKLAEPWERTADGWTSDGAYPRPIWSAAGFLARGDRFIIICGCGARRDAPLAEVEAAGLGDRPMHTLKWKPCDCGGSTFTFEVIDGPRRPADDGGTPDDDDADAFAVEIPEHMRAGED